MVKQMEKKWIVLTDENFQDEVLRSDVPVLVDFWAEWCGPCHMIAPIIDEMADAFAGRAKICKLDVDRHPKASLLYGVRSIPSLLFFKAGALVDQVVGVAPKSELVARLQKLLVNTSHAPLNS